MKRIYIILIFGALLHSCEKSTDTEVVNFKFYGDESENAGYSISKTANGFLMTGLYTELNRQSTAGGTIVGNPQKRMVVFSTDADGNVTG